MVVLLDDFRLTIRTLPFDLAYQTMRAMLLVRRDRFPAVDGHAAQRSVIFTKGFVALRLVDHVFVRVAHTLQFQFVQNVRYHLGAEGLLRRGLAADELLKIFCF